MTCASLILLGLFGMGLPESNGSSDGKGQRGSWANLVSDEAVQRELGLTPEQRHALEDVTGRLTDEKELREHILAALRPHQAERIKQIRWQFLGGEALADPEVTAALSLTTEQEQRLKDARELNTSERREMEEKLQRIRFKSAEDRKEFQDRYRRRADERLLSVISEEQRKKLLALKGKPFKP